MDSTEFMGWDSGGVGTWVTIFANGGHAYMTVAGLRLDTSPRDDPSNQQGPRWRPLRPGNAASRSPPHGPEPPVDRAIDVQRRGRRARDRLA